MSPGRRNLGDRVGGRQGHDAGREQGRAEEAEAEQGCREVTGERLERAGRVAGVVDRDLVDVEGRGAGDDDEQADDPGQHGADDDVDALVAQILDGQPLVDRVGLDEGKAPRGERRPEGRHRDEHRVAGQRHAGHDQAARRRAPVRVGEEA
jgi:hypothetical protein